MIRSPVDFTYLRDSPSFKHFQLPRIQKASATPSSIKTLTPRSNLKRARSSVSSAATASRQDPPDPVYAESARALCQSRAKIRSHHDDKNHDVSGGIFVRGRKRESSAASGESVKQWLSFGAGVKSSAGLVDAFSVMKNPEEYYSIEGQSGLAVAKHLRKMDKVIVGINGKPSPNFAERLQGKRLSDNDWYDKDRVDDLIRQAEELRLGTIMNGDTVPLCWDDQLTVPEVRTVTVKPAAEPEPPKPIPRETTAVVFTKLEVERPAHDRLLITPTRQQVSEASFRVQRRTKTYSRPSTAEAEAVMTIVSIDTNAEKINAEHADSVDYEAFIDDKIPPKQFVRRRKTPTPEPEAEPEPKPQARDVRSAYSQASQTTVDSKLQVRPTSRSILMQTIDDDDFAVVPVRSPVSKMVPSAPTPTPRERTPKSSGKLRRGKSNLGKSAPSIASKYDPADTSYIKIAEGIASPPAAATPPVEKDPPPKPPATPEGPIPVWAKSEPSDTETDTVDLGLQAPAPSLNDDSETPSARNKNDFSISVSIKRRGSKDSGRSAQSHASSNTGSQVSAGSQTKKLAAKKEEEVVNTEPVAIPVATEEECSQENGEAEQEVVETEGQEVAESAEQEVAETEGQEVAETEGQNPVKEEVESEPEIDISPPEVEIKKEKRLRFDV